MVFLLSLTAKKEARAIFNQLKRINDRWGARRACYGTQFKTLIARITLFNQTSRYSTIIT